MGYFVSAGLPNPLTPMKLVLKYESVRLASANPPPSIPGTKRKRKKKRKMLQKVSFTMGLFARIYYTYIF